MAKRNSKKRDIDFAMILGTMINNPKSEWTSMELTPLMPNVRSVSSRLSDLVKHYSYLTWKRKGRYALTEAGRTAFFREYSGVYEEQVKKLKERQSTKDLEGRILEVMKSNPSMKIEDIVRETTGTPDRVLVALKHLVSDGKVSLNSREQTVSLIYEQKEIPSEPEPEPEKRDLKREILEMMEVWGKPVTIEGIFSLLDPEPDRVDLAAEVIALTEEEKIIRNVLLDGTCMYQIKPRTLEEVENAMDFAMNITRNDATVRQVTDAEIMQREEARRQEAVKEAVESASMMLPSELAKVKKEKPATYPRLAWQKEEEGKAAYRIVEVEKGKRVLEMSYKKDSLGSHVWQSVMWPTDKALRDVLHIFMEMAG